MTEEEDIAEVRPLDGTRLGAQLADLAREDPAVRAHHLRFQREGWSGVLAARHPLPCRDTSCRTHHIQPDE